MERMVPWNDSSVDVAALAGVELCVRWWDAFCLDDVNNYKTCSSVQGKASLRTSDSDYCNEGQKAPKKVFVI